MHRRRLVFGSWDTAMEIRDLEIYSHETTEGNLGDEVAATERYQEALEVRVRGLGEPHPRTVRYMNRVAWFQATCRDPELRNGAKAVEHATRACELTHWKKANYVGTLAAAYAEAGDFDSAVKWQKKVIDSLTEEQSSEWAAEFEARMRLYQSGKPYRQSP